MDSIYHKLREQLDTYSLGFPATESGVEITILKKLFSEENAEFVTNLSQKLETPEEVAARLNLPVEKVTEKLKELVNKGLIFSQESNGKRKYAAIAFMHGITEFQVNKLDKEFVTLLARYFDEGFHKNIGDNAELFLRVIPVNKYVEVEHHIASYNDASAILDKVDQIVITDCFCKREKTMAGHGCSRPVEVCFMFGSMGQYYLDNNMGRKITKEEGMKIILEAQKSGLVTQAGTSKNPSGMCNCCGDCCGVLKAIKRFPKPAEMVFSNYYSSIIEENCNGCGACVDICQMEAITMNSSGIAEVDLDRCIGCGLCLVACNVDAVKLSEKSSDKMKEIPSNTKEQFFNMAKNRGLV